VANLQKIDHVVVLMLENRSFDHMLGYLSLTGRRPDIDGLGPSFANEYAGRTYPVHHLETTALDIDPDHSASATDQQMAGGSMGGFVESAAAILAQRGIADADHAAVVGYYDGADLPVYDHLAEEFTVCDRWFSSVPGATLPNRLYALTGGAAGSRDDRPSHVPPIYHKSSFVRHLDAHDVSWRWYSFDPGILRLADLRYRLGHHNRFGYFSKTGLPWRTMFDVTCNQSLPSFLEDAESGELPSVAWIDPAFTNFNPLGFPVNDDHPPADVTDGQDLVLAAYDALAASPQWERSLLVIVYDEHGGFYDHVPPPPAEDDEPDTFGIYGVRVPAIIVSPWAERQSVSHTLFDHTSIFKTILERFCPAALAEPGPTSGKRGLGHPGRLGMRVARANHLGELLTGTGPRPAPSRDALRSAAASRARRAQTQHPAGLPQDPERRPLTDLQRMIQAARQELTRLGHPPDTP
jgi:phospholipase C